MYALLAICQALCPTKVDEGISTAMKEKFGEQHAKVVRGGLVIPHALLTTSLTRLRCAEKNRFPLSKNSSLTVPLDSSRPTRHRTSPNPPKRLSSTPPSPIPPPINFPSSSPPLNLNSLRRLFDPSCDCTRRSVRTNSPDSWAYRRSRFSKC